MLVQRNLFSKEAEEPIPQNYFNLLDNHLQTIQPTEKPFSPNMLPASSVYDGYKWDQSENEIIITFASKVPIDESSIVIDETSITSPFLNGNFFDKVENPDISIEEQNVKITLTVSKYFPILIKSGENMDQYSLFFLAAFSNKVGQIECFEKLLLKASMMNSTMAMSTLAVHYYQQEQHEKAIYWFYQFGRESDEFFPFVTISEILMIINPSLHAHLVENILVTVANKYPTAFTMLAQLHLDTIPGFNSSKELAAQYLEFAVENFHDVNAQRVLAQLYILGKGVQKDHQRGVQLLLESGLSHAQIERLVYMLQNSKEKDEEKDADEGKEKEPIADVVADYAITAAVVAGMVAIGVFAYNFIKRRK
ncbi:hypothetical protein TRFO_29961 [Tritrichomonas foetus]|uniref:CS domain-containing protein n=1 Tax=Tritrichomonas foetus TaxID=1144522 RepID=A0A1J4JUE8_9EUKA|nr:hypothetical protein TRFO_29961 [Tritrichomonas foetus]|eukprot:OHT02775.1 hypothetical protein TRFO_29961 [Tritrichomonas foetus]